MSQGFTITGQVQIERARLVILRSAIKMYLSSGGGMQATRMATPKMMRDRVAEVTGKTYPRSRKGLGQALEDLNELLDTDT